MSIRIYLKSLALSAALVAAMASCVNKELYYNAQLEQFTRSFIKEFGTIDPEQDWNMAQSANVTIELGSRVAQSVKVYSKYSNKYYLVADLIEISGEVNVPIDIPQTSSDVMVRVDGIEYFGTINSQIDCTGEGRQSRTVAASSTTAGNYSISVTKASTLTFNAQQISPITAYGTPWTTYFSLYDQAWHPNTLDMPGILPERGYPNSEDNAKIDSKILNSSDFKFYEDFVFKIGTSGELTIYPYFYGTPDVHVLGIYFIDDQGRPIGTDGKPIEGEITADTKNSVMKFPVYVDSQNEDDIQINPIPVYDISSVGCDVTEVQMRLGDSFDFYPYVYLTGKDKSGNSGTYYNDELIAKFNNTRFAYSISDSYGKCDMLGCFTASGSSTGDNIYLTIAALGYSKTNNRMEKHDEAKTTSVKLILQNSSSSDERYLKSSLPTTAFNAQCYNLEYTNYMSDGKYTFYDGTNQTYTSNSNFKAAVDAFIEAFNNGSATISTSQIKSFPYICGNTFVNYYNSAPSSEDWVISINDESDTKCTSDTWAQISVTFTPKNGSSNAPRRNSRATNYPYVAGTDPYDPNYFFDEDNCAGWMEINQDYNDYRMWGDATSAYYTRYPMLVKTTGYTVKLSSGSGNYDGYIGMYIDVYPNGTKFSNGSFTNSSTHTFFSQRKLNRYSASQSTTYGSLSHVDGTDTESGDVDFDYVYAYAFTHPVTKDMFFSFEDWFISHPSQYDYSVNGNYMGYSYGEYHWGTDSFVGDYNSDRDFNDLIYRMYSADVQVTSTETIEVTDTDDVGYSWLWALEDLGSTDDFDFNDVVVRIRSITTNHNVNTYVDGVLDEDQSSTTPLAKKVQITPLAAGGTLPIYLHYKAGGEDYILAPSETAYDLTKGTKPTDLVAGKEFHQWFGDFGSGQMINTGNGSMSQPIYPDKMSCTLIVSSDFNIAWGTDNNYDSTNGIGDAVGQNSFYVTVISDATVETLQAIDPEKAKNEGYVITETYQGAAPQSFIIVEPYTVGDNTDCVWAWPSERTHINEAYPYFKNWVANKSSNPDWYKYPATNTNGKILTISRNLK